MNSEQNSLPVCNQPNDQKSSANSCLAKGGSAERRRVDERRIFRLTDRASGDQQTCTSPNPTQTANGKPSNGVSNYNIETLLAESAKRQSDSLNELNDQHELSNAKHLQLPSFEESDLYKQAAKGNMELYRDCLYKFYYSFYYAMQQTPIGDQLNGV